MITLTNKMSLFLRQQQEPRHRGRDTAQGEQAPETTDVVSEPQEANNFVILFSSVEHNDRLEADKTFQEIYDAAAAEKSIWMSAPERHFIGFPTGVQFDEENGTISILLRAAETDDGWELTGSGEERPRYVFAKNS